LETQCISMPLTEMHTVAKNVYQHLTNTKNANFANALCVGKVEMALITKILTGKFQKSGKLNN